MGRLERLVLFLRRRLTCSLWPQALEFKPERWLSGEPDPSPYKFPCFNAGWNDCCFRVIYGQDLASAWASAWRTCRHRCCCRSSSVVLLSLCPPGKTLPPSLSVPFCSCNTASRFMFSNAICRPLCASLLCVHHHCVSNIIVCIITVCFITVRIIITVCACASIKKRTQAKEWLH